MSALTEAVFANKPKLCPVAQARETLDPESAADFDAWMAGKPVTIEGEGEPKRLTDKQMWQALQGMRYRVGMQTLGRHRRSEGECGCRP